MLLFDCFHPLGFCTLLAFPLRCFLKLPSNILRVQGRAGLQVAPGRAGTNCSTQSQVQRNSGAPTQIPSPRQVPILLQFTFLYRQTSVTTSPRFWIVLFDTIVSPSSTFWKISLVSYFLTRVIWYSSFLQISSRLKAEWSSLFSWECIGYVTRHTNSFDHQEKFTAPRYCSFN